MSTQELYKDTIDWMKDSLQQIISNFSGAYDVAFNVYNSQPLFSITSKELALLKQVDYFSKFQTRNALAQLCKNLAIEFGRHIIDAENSSNVDFYDLCEGQKIGYYISMNEPVCTPNLESAVAAGITKHIVVVPKSSLINLPSNSHKDRKNKHKSLSQAITLEDFFNIVAPGEFEVFQEYIGRFNYDAEIMLGLVVSPIPTQKAIEKKREKIIAEFESFFFQKSLPSSFTSDDLDFLRERFNKCGIFQLTTAPFIDSFISSEWYFDLRASTDGEMEQTAIVAGYLKAIEQLLFSLMLSICDTHNFKLMESKSKQYVVLTKANTADLLTMANNLLTSIDINYKNSLYEVYINEIMGSTVQSFLHDFFKHTRNGYFHKDNIYTFPEIQSIREQAYCAFFLLVSTFLFNLSDLKTAIT